MRRKTDTELARYQDSRGRPHRVVLRGRLALDLCQGEPARVVCELSAEEGAEQARAVLFGSPIDEGYLARAGREERPFCRALGADELTPRREAAADGPADDRAGAPSEPPRAA